MTVMDVLLRMPKSGLELTTPVRAKKFIVESIHPSGVTLILGEGWRTPVPAVCWNGIPRFLRGKGWVEIGATYGKSKEGTLQHYVDDYTPRKAASHVASVLRHAGIVEIGGRPSQVRLIDTDLD